MIFDLILRTFLPGKKEEKNGDKERNHAEG